MSDYQKLLEVITKAQNEFIGFGSRRDLFDSLLSGLLDVTMSEYGFIGERCLCEDGNPYLKVRAVTEAAWGKGSPEFRQLHPAMGIEFYSPHSLFGEVLSSAQPLISNDPSGDRR